MQRAVAQGVEVLCCAGSKTIWRKDAHGGSSSVFCKSHAANIFGRDASRIVGGFGCGGGSLLLQLHADGSRALEGRAGHRMMQAEVLVDVCDRLDETSNSEEALRELWRQITGTGSAKSHNVMHMQHKQGQDNQLAAALHVWLEEQCVDVAGGGGGGDCCGGGGDGEDDGDVNSFLQMQRIFTSHWHGAGRTRWMSRGAGAAGA